MSRSISLLLVLSCLTCVVALPFGASTTSAQEAEQTPPAEETTPAEDAEATPATEAEPAADEPAAAEEPAEAPAMAAQADLDALWTLLAACLVFFMQAGFAMVESGFTRAKNACNIMMKNLMDFSIGSLSFWLVGFGLMFGVTSGGWIGTNNFIFDATSADATAVGNTESFSWAFLIFQTVFCATAATIVSGAMAERTKFSSYLIYSVGITAIIYPIFGSWAWGSLWAGEGWLEGWSFYDFAGSTVVHSIGGWCALAGAIVIGPRIGKFKDGKAMPIPGHNIPLAALGVFILWLGWFGFNAGSTTSITGSGASFSYIAVTTNLAAAAGVVGALVTSWIMFKKPDTSFALNGALAGLVSITAGCDALEPAYAALAGLIGGVLVVFSVIFFDKLKIDDPVGAVSVHGVCGVWGTLAVGLFNAEVAITSQLVGVGAAFAWAFPTSFLMFFIIKKTVGLRASQQEEMEGLDLHEHGMLAYPPGFVSELQVGAHVSAGPGMGLSGLGGGAPVANPATPQQAT